MSDVAKLVPHEQIVEIVHEGEPFRCRRVVVKLSRPTRDQEWEIAIFTNH